MKSFFRITFGIIVIVIFVAIITFIIDRIRATDGKKPIAAILVFQEKDGGTKQYYGLGYKVIAYNKLNGYNKIHIGTYFLKYDDKLGQDNELAECCRNNVLSMNKAKDKDIVVFTLKDIKNKDKFFTFVDAVDRKDPKRFDLKFITYTKEGDEIKQGLVYENESLFYTIDNSNDRFADEEKRNDLITYELEPLIKIKQTKDKKRTIFYSNHKMNNEEIILVQVEQKLLIESKK